MALSENRKILSRTMENVKQLHFYATNAQLTEEAYETVPTRDCTKVINPTLEQTLHYGKKEPTRYPCFVMKKNSFDDLFILIGTTKPPTSQLNRYVRVRGQDCNDPLPTDLKTIPDRFYTKSFYLDLACVMLTEGICILVHTQFQNDNRDVKLSPESENALIEMFHSYHKSTLDRSNPNLITISPYIYVYNSDVPFSDEWIDPQMEELAQDYCGDYYVIEIAKQASSIYVPAKTNRWWTNFRVSQIHVSHFYHWVN